MKRDAAEADVVVVLALTPGLCSARDLIRYEIRVLLLSRLLGPWCRPPRLTDLSRRTMVVAFTRLVAVVPEDVARGTARLLTHREHGPDTYLMGVLVESVKEGSEAGRVWDVEEESKVVAVIEGQVWVVGELQNGDEQVEEEVEEAVEPCLRLVSMAVLGLLLECLVCEECSEGCNAREMEIGVDMGTSGVEGGGANDKIRRG